MSIAPLYVYYEDKEIGHLQHDHDQQFIFQYSSTWLQEECRFPISLSMPLDDKQYHQEAHAYFTNLLPEGALKSLICQKLKISENNHYELLRKIGGECAGAIRILEEDSEINSSGDSYQLIDKLSSIEMMITTTAYGHHHIRLSLAGAQYKLPIYFIKNQFHLPVNGSPSSHILKFQNQYFKNLPVIEILSTHIARLMELDTIEIEAVIYEKNKLASLSKRYDRLNLNGKIKRLHQEDFCQVLGTPPYQKYEEENGPGFKDCFEAIEQYSTIPIIDKKKLIEATVLNVLIGNCDAHAKNISYLFSEGKTRLSPLYDIVSTLMYPQVSTQMAMSIGGEKNIFNVGRSNWKKWAEDIKVSPNLVLETVEKMTQTFIDNNFDWYQQVSKNIPEQLAIRVQKKVLKQCKNIRQKF